MPEPSPGSEGYRQPAEWSPHAACWLAWPSDASLWKEDLAPARCSFVELCRTIADPDPQTGAARGEELEILVHDPAGESEARAALAGVPARYHHIPFGDIWLRDTAPIFVAGENVAAVSMGFNGWGGKYVLPHDDQVSERIAERSGLRSFRFGWVLEGGSAEVDGEGTLLTTRQCLLNHNRNPGVSQAEIEAGLRAALGAESILWLDRGLANDHTDGHVDTLARFVRPGVVACSAPAGADDPNREVLEDVARRLASFRDAAGRRLEVVRIPSPGAVYDEGGRLMPASYANFYVANRTVAVPLYDSPQDASAVEAIAALFPERRTVGIPAKAVLTGGGAFHCITQQQPVVHQRA